jgi:hypothetical protein
MAGRTNGRLDKWQVGQMVGRTNDAFCVLVGQMAGRTNGRLDKCRSDKRRSDKRRLHKTRGTPSTPIFAIT